MRLITAKKYILDLLFPIKCLGCSQENENYLCNNCAQNIMFTDANFHLPHIDRVYSAAKYDSVLIMKLIKEMKYRFIKDISNTLGQLLVSYIKFEDVEIENPIVIPVPLSKKRYNWRGFNQSELMAKIVAENFNWDFNNEILIKIKDIKPQAEIENEKLRKNNTINAFKTTENIQRNIILIDDVTTSGSTLSECARILKRAGAKKIIAITVAHG